MSRDGRAPGPSTGARVVALVAIAALSSACAGGRFYRPASVHEGHAPGAAVESRAIWTQPTSESTWPSGVIIVHSAYQTQPGVALTSPHLAPASSAPCQGGAAATGTTDHGTRKAEGAPSSGALEATFARGAVDRDGLLWATPTALDLTVLYTGAPAGCLRAPLVEGSAPAQWNDVPTWSLGTGFRLFAPFQRIYGVDLTAMFVLRFGRWLGPVRLRAELAAGGALAHGTNPNLTGYSYGAGLLADYLLLSAGHFGLGAMVGYDFTGISFGANVDALSHDGAGFAGPIVGPRAGLSFGWIPTSPAGGAFRARPDARSTTLEIFGAALSSQDPGGATAALWFMLSVDAGW